MIEVNEYVLKFFGSSIFKTHFLPCVCDNYYSITFIMLYGVFPFIKFTRLVTKPFPKNETHEDLFSLVQSGCFLSHHLSGLQQHLLHAGVAAPDALPLPVLTPVLHGHLPLGFVRKRELERCQGLF
jgi:hypothetical protein